jgi:CxxC-x17-CxxC domain-containing protein
MGSFKEFTRERPKGKKSTKSGRGDFHRFSRDESTKRRSGRDRFERSDRDSRVEMHETTCDECNRVCEVPFRPTSGKPVYCSNCFNKNDSYEKKERGLKGTSSDLDKINRKLDKILRILESE